MEFTSGQLFLFVLRGLTVAALPFAVLFLLKKKSGVSGYPMFVGLITVMLMLLPRELFRNVLVKGAETDTGKWLTVWFIGACFEELGRYFAMKYAMPNHDTLPDALCYGIGHGGAEVFTSARMQFMLLFEAYTGTGERLEALADQGILTAVTVIIGNMSNLAFHMAMSVLIARAVHYDGCKKLIPLAVFVHVLANFTEFCFGGLASLMLTAVIWIFVYLHGKQMQERGFDAF